MNNTVPTQNTPPMMWIRRRKIISALSFTSCLLFGELLLPVGNEHVCLARLVGVTIRCPHELLSIGTEHRKSVERLVERDLLEILCRRDRRGRRSKFPLCGFL